MMAKDLHLDEAYLRLLNVPSAVAENFERQLSDWSSFLVSEPETLLLSEYAAENRRVFEALWIFSPTHVYELRNSQLDVFSDDRDGDNIDVCFIHNQILHLVHMKKNLSSSASNEYSKFGVTFRISDGFGGKIRATGANAARLWDASQRYLLPNVRK